MGIMKELYAYYWCESSRLSDLQKADHPIEPVAIREGQRRTSLTAHSLTERLQRGHAVHRRIGRMRMEMHEVSRHSQTPPIPDHIFTESSLELVERHREMLGAGLPSLLGG